MWGRAVSALLCGCLIGSSAWAQQPAEKPFEKRWVLTVDTDTRYSTWQRTSGNPAGEPNQHGWQVYSPFGVQILGAPTDDLKVELLLRGGYVKASRSANPNLIDFKTGTGTGFTTGTVSTATDTILGSTFTYLGFDGFQPFYSLNFNVPTGQSVLFGLASLARSDPDLVEVPSFGQGLNSTNTVGVNVPFTSNMMLTVSGGYMRGGEFDRENQTVATLLGLTSGMDRIKPSDTRSVNANLAMGFGQLTINLSGMTSWDTASQFNGVETFRNGRTYFGTGTVGYNWNDMWSSSLTGSYSHSQHMMVADPVTGALLPEPLDSNSDLARASFTQTVSLQPFVLNFMVNYLHRFQNEYNMTAQSFVPAKTKWSTGASAKYPVNDTISLNTRIEHFWINEAEKPDPTIFGAPIGPSQGFDGWIFTFGATARI